MARSNSKGMLPNGRKAKTGSFAGIPRDVMKTEDYTGLGGNSIRLLNEFARMYNGKNNGDLSAAWSIMRARGFNSEATLARAVKELKDAGFIRVSRPGHFSGRKSTPTLYCLTWLSIDECEGKHDLEPTSAPVRAF